jgi:hypothetical protein
MSSRERWGFVLFVALLATLVTALFTTPLVFRWRTHFVGFHGSDALAHAWSLWWFDKALFRLGQSPAQVNYVSYPTPFYQPLFVAASYARLVTLPVVHWGSPVMAYNIHLFVSYVLTWVLTSLLCLELTDSQAAAVVGGAIFTFCLPRTLHAVSGHYTLILTYPYPLLALCLWRVLKRPSIGRGLALGAALILISTVDLMPLAYFAAPVTASMLVFFLLADRPQVLSCPALKSLGLGFGSAALVLLPAVVWPLLSSAARGELGFYHAAGILDYSADALGLVLPPPWHPICRAWPALWAFSAQAMTVMGYQESIVYAGWVTLVLAAIGAVWGWRKQRDVRLWIAIAVSASLLAMGPVLRIGGQLVTFGGRRVMLPYALVEKLPLLSWGRTPGRLSFTAMFALAILAAYGVAWVVGRIRQYVWRQVMALGIVALILLDVNFQFPWPMADAGVPAFYEDLAADQRAVAVLDLPTAEYTADVYYMLYQMAHGHAIVGGYLYRRPPEAEESMAELEALARPGGDPLALASYGIGYVVLHRDFLERDDLEALTAHLVEHLGPPLYEDEQIAAFAVPGAREIAPPPVGVPM